MCLDKYLKSLGINGMVQKIQIRQTHRENQGGCMVTKGESRGGG